MIFFVNPCFLKPQVHFFFWEKRRRILSKINLNVNYESRSFTKIANQILPILKLYIIREAKSHTWFFISFFQLLVRLLRSVIEWWNWNFVSSYKIARYADFFKWYDLLKLHWLWRLIKFRFHYRIIRNCSLTLGWKNI